MKAILQSLLKISFGQWTIAMLMLCLFSGVLLLIPYDLEQAFNSIVAFQISNPFASFFRNMHYWSAQFFLLFSLLHIIDHFIQKSEQQVKIGVWFRLVTAIVILYLAMLTGFLLKADTDSQQAWRILHFLLASIPWIGENMAFFILGNQPDSLLIPYLHHVSTFTILILLMVFEHARQIWPKALTFIVSLFVLSIISSYLSAPLHLGMNPMVKGPWYFVGFQEILHWMNQPSWSLLLLGLLLFAIFILKFLRNKPRKFISILLYALAIFYIFLTFIGFYFRGENWKWENQINKEKSSEIFKFYNIWSGQKEPIGEFKEIQKKESCMWCHSTVSGFMASHDVNAIGCSSCHLGNKLSTNKEVAHRDMVVFPGNLSNARLTCATKDCHPNELEHISQSLMTTNSGLVAVDKYVFHESDDLDALYHIEQIGHSPAETHIRNLCANCHLGKEKDETGPIHEKSRGGGCLACHLHYTENQRASHEEYAKGISLDSIPNYQHPQLHIQIDNSKCFGCHSRSGRISTNYEGWHETLISHQDYVDSDSLRLLEDKRVFEMIAPDIHHQAGLQCIDCHPYQDIMGDGQSYSHQEEAVKIQCEDCHTSGFTSTTSYDKLTREEKKIFDLRAYDEKQKSMILTKVGNTTLIHTEVLHQTKALLKGKFTEKNHPLKSPAQVCTAEVHQNVSCSLCHSSWVPQCLGCHNSYDPEDDMGYDLLERKKIEGEWNEYIGKYFHEAPVIGVRENANEKKFIAAAPGMIMTIDTASFYSRNGAYAFHRLYAPLSPHTTQSKGRDCKSCHLNALSLGFGRGSLSFDPTEEIPQWKFDPQFAPSPYDQLPEDAWTSFLEGPPLIGKSTRSDFRSMSKEEQKTMLRLGACLSCHSEESHFIRASLNGNFNDIYNNRPEVCKVPL